MRITVVSGDQLTNRHLVRWEEVLRDNARLDSPFFRPEYIMAAAEARDDVAVGILETEDRIAGFFPFQRGRWNIGQAVGRPLSDFQGVIAGPAAQWNARTMIRDCGLAGWQFDHLLADQPFHDYHRATVPSPFMDISRGYDAYQEDLRRNGRQRFSGILRKTRMAEQRIGPMRFEFHTIATEVYEQLIRWKTAQYERTRTLNVFALPWVLQLLESIRGCQGEAFSGTLSALYFGDRLAAAHFGMRSRSVLHYWFPAYDKELAQYSPGLICLLKIARAAAAVGIRRIDLGKGDESYKRRLMSGATTVAEGHVLARPLVRMLGCAWYGAGSLARLPVLGAPLRWAGALRRFLPERRGLR